MNLLEDFFNCSKRKAKIAVIGDSMLDKYARIRVRRISPENPIKIMLSSPDEKPKVFPGGASNVANQMKHWNVDIYLLSALSQKDVFKDFSFNTDLSVVIPEWSMPEKIRYYDG